MKVTLVAPEVPVTAAVMVATLSDVSAVHVVKSSCTWHAVPAAAVGEAVGLAAVGAAVAARAVTNAAARATLFKLW